MNRACICQSSVIVCVWRAKIKGILLTYLLKMRISCSEVDRHESTYGEVTSQSLWSRYERHFVGITRHNASVKWRRFIVLFEWNWINWVPKMSTWSTYQQNVFKRYHSDEHFSEFLPTRWRRKSTGIDIGQNYVTVTPCIVRQTGPMLLCWRQWSERQAPYSRSCYSKPMRWTSSSLTSSSPIVCCSNRAPTTGTSRLFSSYTHSHTSV